MNRRILAVSLIVCTVISLFSFKVFGTSDVKTFERVDFISGIVNANELNLRNGPSMDSEIIGTFKRHKWVNVLAEIGDWYAVFDPESGKVGCVAKQYLIRSDSVPQQKVTPQQPAKTPQRLLPQPLFRQNGYTYTCSEQPQTTDLSQNEKLLLTL